MMNYAFRLLLIIGVLSTSSLLFNKVCAQTSGLNGTWQLDSVYVKKDIPNIEEEKFSMTELPSLLYYDCFIKINVQHDETTLTLANDLIYSAITFLLENNKLTVSLFPGHLSNYNIEYRNDKLILIDPVKFIESIYTHIAE